MTLPGRIRATAAYLWSDGRGPTLLTVAAAWFLALGMRLAFPAALPYVRADLGLDNATAGLLVTALWGSYAITQFPAGLLTDRVGERRILVVSTLLGGLATLALGATAGLGGAVLGVVLFGLGTGLFATPRVMVISHLYPDRATTALGVVFAAGNVGNAVLPALVGVTAGILGWRAGFLAAAPLFLVAAVGVRLALPGTSPGPAADASSADDPDGSGDDAATGAPDIVAAAAELRRRPVRFATAALILFAFGYQGLVGFLPTYLVDAKGVAPEVASLLFGVFFASGLIAQLAAGTLADAYGRRRLLVATLAVTVVGIVALTLAGGVAAIAGVVALLGVQLGFWPVVNAYAYDALSGGSRGGGYGFIRTVYLVLGATGPLVVGSLFDANRYDGGFVVLAAVFALVLLVCATLPAVERPAGASEPA
ncbi:MAG: MFS transporter [Haloferacaceae archaeon]